MQPSRSSGLPRSNSRLDVEIERTKAVGTLRMAHDFARAGELFHTHYPDTIAAPPFYLYCHAIELSLKSLLIARGTSERQLRRIGHDLDAGLEAAVSQGLG